jgi:hypothetical protein
VGEQAEQPLDPGAGATQVLGGLGVVERLAGGDPLLLVRLDRDRPAAAGRLDTACSQRAAIAGGLGEARAPPAGGLDPDRRDLAGRASHRPGIEVDIELALGDPAALTGASGTGASTSTSRTASSARTGPVP